MITPTRNAFSLTLILIPVIYVLASLFLGKDIVAQYRALRFANAGACIDLNAMPRQRKVESVSKQETRNLQNEC